MPTSDPTDTLATIHRIKEEIDRLSEQQKEALKTATFVGMTHDEAKDYDSRRARITELIHELALLQKAQCGWLSGTATGTQEVRRERAAAAHQ
jgi:hypothetical protein